MNRSPRGRYFPLSVQRQTVCDLLHFGKQMPTVPVQRQMNLSPLREARAASASGVSWTLLFTRAYALVAREDPFLRQAFLSFPWERVYEHPFSYAAIPIEREYQGQPELFVHIQRAPEERSLAELQAELEAFRTQPVESFPQVKRARFFARFPRFMRRFLWWYVLNADGGKRARYFGTFGVSVYSALGAESLHPIAPWTTTLNYGVIAPDGSVPVRLIYDHRLMDGARIARALIRLEEILNGPIAKEVLDLAPRACAA